MKSAGVVIAWAGVVTGALVTFWWDVRPGGYFVQMLRRNSSSSVVKFAHQFDDIDADAKKLAPADGNLAIGFRGYSPISSDNANFAARLYFRFTYALYPKRVFPAVPENTLINNGGDILAATAPPTLDWLHARDIRTIAVFSLTPQGESFVQPLPVPNPAPPNMPSAGMPGEG
jgi:hypothetical protein